jgi:hypothetical protein
LFILSNTLDLRLVDICDFNIKKSAYGMLKLIPQMAIKDQSNRNPRKVKQVTKVVQEWKSKPHSPGLLTVVLSLPWLFHTQIRRDVQDSRAVLLFAREVSMIEGTGMLPFSG